MLLFLPISIAPVITVFAGANTDFLTPIPNQYFSLQQNLVFMNYKSILGIGLSYFFAFFLFLFARTSFNVNNTIGFPVSF